MIVKMRCNRKVFREDGIKVVTERTFVSTDREGKQMNEGVIGAQYSDTIVGDAEDTSVVLHGVVSFNFDSEGGQTAMPLAKVEAAKGETATGPLPGGRTE